MEKRKHKRETERVVKKVLRFVETHDPIGKAEFETLLQQVMEHVHNNTGRSLPVIAQQTDSVIRALPTAYGHVPEEARSWEALMTDLYTTYLSELGLLSLPLPVLG